MNEIQYEVRERDLIAFNEHLAWGSASLQKHLRRHQSQVPGFIVLISLLLWFYYKDSLSALYVATIALLWGFGVPAYLKWNLRRQIRKLYTHADKEQILGRVSLRIEKNDLVETSDRGESRTPWSEMLRIEATKKYAFLFVAPRAALIIPRATVSKGDLQQFVLAADERITAADAA
jgi:YcxB-like protein